MEKPLKPARSHHVCIEDPREAQDAVVNDSLGTINTSDSTGTDDDLETGDAKDKNFDTHED